MIRDVEIHVEALQVASGLLLEFLDLEMRKHHAAFLVLRVRQRQKARGEYALLADLIGSHGRELFPGNSGGKLDPNTRLQGFAATHLSLRIGPVAQIVALVQQVGLAFCDRGFIGAGAREQ